MDDLHWADATSLDILQMIVTHPDLKYCLCIGCYRDENTSLTEKVTAMLNGIKSQDISVSVITLARLEQESVNMMISEKLCLPLSLCKILSLIVHNKTAGAALFLVNFLQSLGEEGVIRFNLSKRRNEYDIGHIRRKEVPAGAVLYMKSQMSKLLSGYSLALKVASCLGHEFDYVTMKRAKVMDACSLEYFLPTLTSLGFIQELSPSTFVWAHDQVQQAAYELIQVSQRESFQLLIGTKLYMNTPENELEGSIFLIVSQLNIGKRLVLEDDDTAYDVAKLNLVAGEKAISTSSFRSAAGYFLAGIGILPEGSWECRYHLTLDLHDAALDALLVIGDFTKLHNLAYKHILPNTVNFDDKLNCYLNLVRYLVASGQLEKGISTCTKVLGKLGVEFPDAITEAIGMKEFLEVKHELSAYSDDQILSLPLISDKHNLGTMELLGQIIAPSTRINPLLTMVLACKMVLMTLKYGLCDVSAIAFGVHGALLTNLLYQDIEGGYRMGSIALKILNKFPEQNRFTSRVLGSYYGSVYIWREPFQGKLPLFSVQQEKSCCV